MLIGPDRIWMAWTVDPLVVGGLLLVAGLYTNGLCRSRKRPQPWRRRSFVLGLTTVFIALVSPLEAMATALVSAHMAQHLLLALVAAPAFAVAAPGSTLLRGLPGSTRRHLAGLRGRAGIGTARTRSLWGPWGVFLLYVGVLWAWHARVLHEAALTSAAVHVVEHVSIFGAALLLWGLVVGAHGARRVERGQVILVVFGAGVQGVLLSALLVFSRQVWYAGYAGGPALWGLSPIADQQLAGAVLSTMGAVVHLAAVLVLLAAWMRQSDLATAPGQGT